MKIQYTKRERFVQPYDHSKILSSMEAFAEFTNIYIPLPTLPEGPITVNKQFLDLIGPQIQTVELACAPRYLLEESVNEIISSAKAYIGHHYEDKTTSELIKFLKISLVFIQSKIDEYSLLKSLKNKMYLVGTVISDNNLTIINEDAFSYLFGDRLDSLLISLKEERKELWQRISEIFKQELTSHEQEFYTVSKLEKLGTNKVPTLIIEFIELLKKENHIIEDVDNKLEAILKTALDIEKKKYTEAKSSYKNNRNPFGATLRAIEKHS